MPKPREIPMQPIFDRCTPHAKALLSAMIAEGCLDYDTSYSLAQWAASAQASTLDCRGVLHCWAGGLLAVAMKLYGASSDEIIEKILAGI